MEFGFKLQVKAKKEKIWEYYAVLKNRFIWEKDLKDIKLDGEFKRGAKGVMELNGLPPMEYTLTLVEENRRFFDRTQTPMGIVRFGHEIIEDGAECEIRHTVGLENADATLENIGVLQQIFSDVPHSMFCLKEAAENS
ncbi:MAG: hypothetical protein ACTTKL_04850 [Treponema sp.]